MLEPKMRLFLILKVSVMFNNYVPALYRLTHKTEPVLYAILLVLA